MILAPATMAAEKEAKEAARKCLEEIGLDAESYRIGHTKARENAPEIPPLYRDFFWIDFELFPPHNHKQLLKRKFHHHPQVLLEAELFHYYYTECVCTPAPYLT